jgi:alpha-amylase/alpha-mannosidase (GH57 family)
MHQPYYKNDFTGFYELPWTFLHSTKDYYEMPKYFDDFKKIKAVFNIVPSLAFQIEEYASKKANDLLMSMLKKPVETLNDEDKSTLIPQLFMANVENMILTSPRYTELFNKFEHFKQTKTLTYFNNSELIDIEVHFLLAWTGTYVKEGETFIQTLINKDANYSENEKQTLIEILYNKVADILPLYKKLAEKNRIELSTSPFYHPIIPLLIDINAAKESYPNVILPRGEISLSIDAAAQIDEAINYHTKTFEIAPQGMWPSEGSISKESAKLFSYFGINWIASDEDVLSNSIRTPMNIQNNRRILYHKHKFTTINGDLYIFFRDKKLSDFIGFQFADLHEDQAVSIFMSELRKIYDSVEFNAHVSVILDGENAWEFYPQNGRPFFSRLYNTIENTNWIKTITFSEAISEPTIPVHDLKNITAGSWIYGNLLTWVGHSEKNRAWELLGMTKEKVENVVDRLSEQDRIELTKEIHIAEGSDWFWWYGDDHYSPQADIFDKLFRLHLINAFKIATLPIPHELYIPIKSIVTTGVLKDPTSFISPEIDGKISNFFEWLSAGKFNLKYDMGTMHSDINYLSTLLWGFDNKFLYLRVDGKLDSIMNKGYILELRIVSLKEYLITFELNENVKEICVNNIVSDEILVGIKNIIEIALPFSQLDLEDENHIMLLFRLRLGDEIVERSPLYNYAHLNIDGNIIYNWMV